MATTIGSFSAIDDSEVDAESPITETLITRLRDNSYWIDAGTRKTTETDTTKVLKPDGSGGVQWSAGGGGGSKGILTVSTSATITTETIGMLMIEIFGFENDSNSFHTASAGSITIDLSDDTFVGAGGYMQATSGPTYTGTTASLSGTLTGTHATILSAISGGAIQMRRNGGNIDIQTSGSITSPVHAKWVII